jgi:hypothetical protein
MIIDCHGHYTAGRCIDSIWRPSCASSKKCPLAAPATLRFLHRLYQINHELSEKVREFVVRIERKNIGDVLIGTHNH